MFNVSVTSSSIFSSRSLFVARISCHIFMGACRCFCVFPFIFLRQIRPLGEICIVPRSNKSCDIDAIDKEHTGASKLNNSNLSDNIIIIILDDISSCVQ